MVAKIVIVLQYVGLDEVPDEHRSECPVIVLQSEKGNYTCDSKRTLTGLMQATYSVFFIGVKQQLAVGHNTYGEQKSFHIQGPAARRLHISS